jgi:hypothetical protein
VEIMPDKVILDHKKSYFVSFEIFHFFQFLAKIGTSEKITKNKNFQITQSTCVDLIVMV